MSVLLVREPASGETPSRLPVRVRVPAWARLTLAVFLAVELTLLLALRIASGLADAHAVEEIGTDLTAGTASAACTEGLAAVDDLWPAVPLLNIARLLPSPTARAWGQVPGLVEVARQACPAVQAYASIAPTLDRSLQDGVAADVLKSVRRDQAQLDQANQQLAAAWPQVDQLDIAALSSDPRLERVARLVERTRAQKEDVSDGLALLAPPRLEALLGGSAPRAIVLSAPNGQAYMVFDQGALVRVGLDQPDVAPVAIVSVDQAGLATLRETLTRAEIPAGAPDDVVAESLLAELVRQSLNDDANVAAVVRHSADDGHAWLSFDDPALQQLAARRGWIRQ